MVPRGLGHPDYICDAAMDAISVALSQEYLRAFGAVAHHNIDKALLAAGEVEYRFGGGSVKSPMTLIIGDRATYEVDDVHIPVSEIAVKTAKRWFKEHLRFVDPEEHLRFQVELKPGSSSLRDIFQRKGAILGANDTSAAVGYAPLTKTEKLVLLTERFLNSPSFKKRFPESGEDIKVMGLRVGNDLQLTVSMAFVDRFIDTENTYFRRKQEILQEIERLIDRDADFDKAQVHLNTLDERGRGIDGLYLTVLGTSADGADSGQVGRGNRVNGVIPLNRPISSEAAAGKNPVSHIGKIYNLLSHRIAGQICEEVNGVEEAYVWLLSQIGKPINEPKITAVQLIPRKGTSLASISGEVKAVVDAELADIQTFCKELAEGKMSMC
ncbi:MAG: methionine adenosyltransferase [Candidatus Bathyarchaeia archaeon]